MESKIEKKIRIYVESKGGKFYKWVSPGNNGMPDRICIMPGRCSVFVEVKDTGKKPGPLQLIRHQELRNLGQTVIVTDSLEDFKNAIQSL